MNQKEKHPWAWRVLVASLFAATLAASWGAFGGAGCQSCEGLAGTFDGKNLATLGTLYYTILFAVAVLAGPHLVVFAGIMIAAGVHAPLLAILFQSKLWCAPCLLAGASALCALIAAIVLEPSNAFRGALLVPAAALALQTWVIFSGAVPAPQTPPFPAIEHEDFQAPRVAPGTVRMVVYTRPDCGYCIELERDVLPDLVRDFGKDLLVERRSAEALPGIPTPTIILSGHEKRRLFPGLPPATQLRSAIESVMGGKDGRETLSQKSR